jgi:putative effector of murein hydrolase LrgA (UPF0299 family)
METSPKAPTLLELNWSMPQAQLYLDKLDLIFFPYKVNVLHYAKYKFIS